MIEVIIDPEVLLHLDIILHHLIQEEDLLTKVIIAIESLKSQKILNHQVKEAAKGIVHFHHHHSI